jgi:hypothetical protein
LAFLNKIDEKVLYDANINSKSWFDIITEENIYRQRIVRDSVDNHENFIKLKIINTQGFKTIIRLNNEKNISIEEIPQFSWVKMILECYAITISNYGINLFVRPIIMSFEERIVENYNYKFLNDSDSDEDSDRTTQVFNTSNIFINKEEDNNENENNSGDETEDEENNEEDDDNVTKEDIELDIMVEDDDEESELIENIFEKTNINDSIESETSQTSNDV